MVNFTMSKSVCVIDYDILGPYGAGVDVFMKGLRSGCTAIREFKRFPVAHLRSKNAAYIPDTASDTGKSLFFEIIERLLEKKKFDSGAFLITATTVGPVDLLENYVSSRTGNPQNSSLSFINAEISSAMGLSRKGLCISSACASSISALARAVSLIKSGRERLVVILAADIVSEFVFAGFSSLMALDEDKASPFDRNRKGLSIGETASYIVLCERGYADELNILSEAEVLSCAQTNDSNHMTGPSRDGAGLSDAIDRALTAAGVSQDEICFISAHGTGTKYNDTMEIKAFKRSFLKPVPCFGIKGAIGHTMASAGMAQIIASIESLRDGYIPPTTGLASTDDESAGWVIPARVDIFGKTALVVNAGFGGINAAAVLGAL